MMQFESQLQELKSIVFNFEKSKNEQKLFLLNELQSHKKITASQFTNFHHTLMCMMAYPSCKEVLMTTQKTCEALLSQIKHNNRLQQKLTGTGIYNSYIECNFSYELVKDLIGLFPNQISIHSAVSSLETQKAALKLVFPYTEYSLIHDGDKDIKSRLKSLFSDKKQTDLEQLISTIQNSDIPNNTKAFVYNQLGIYITLQQNSIDDSVTFLRGADLPIYYHKTPIQKYVDTKDIINKPLPKPSVLSIKQKEQLIKSAKLTLTYLYRETEPFTNANINDITLFELEHGISIALFGCKPEKRYSLESYIGYLVLKNNIPISYGGGWLFGQRSQFGINILESFRGGESQLIICELLRVYHQHLGAKRFVVKPYQFGLHNPEAIKTGAFWFYYKLGFRPQNLKLKELALHEAEQKKKNPTYKSSDSTLRKYLKSNIELVLDESSFPNYDSEELSKKITTHINTYYNGDRSKALEACLKEVVKYTCINTETYSDLQLKYTKEVSVLFCAMGNNQWLGKNKKNIIKYIETKFSKSEKEWIKHLQQFKEFWKV